MPTIITSGGAVLLAGSGGTPATRVALALTGIVLGGLVGCWLREEWVAPLSLSKPNKNGLAQASRPAAPRATVVLLVVVALCAAMTGLNRTDAVLHAFHQPGEASFGVDAATGVFSLPLDRAGRLSEAIQAWSRDVQARRTAEASRTAATPDDPGSERLLDARPLLALQFAINSFVLVPSYALLLGLLIRAGRRVLQREWRQILQTTDSPAVANQARVNQLIGSAGGATTVAGYLQWGKWAVACVMVAACANWCENGLAFWLVDAAWAGAARGGVSGELPCGRVCNALAIVLGVTTWAKLGALLLVSVHLLAVGLLALQHGGSNARTWTRLPDIRAAVIRLLFPAGIAVVFGILLLSNDQAPDILRRWTHGRSQTGVIVAGIGTTLLLAAAVALGAWWLPLSPRNVPAAPPRNKPAAVGASSPKIMTNLGWWFCGAGLLWYAVVWLVAWGAANGWLPWWGVVLGVGVLGGGLALKQVRGWIKSWRQTRWLTGLGAVVLVVDGAVAYMQDRVLAHVLYPFAPLVVVAAVVVLGLPFARWRVSKPKGLAQFRAAPGYLAASIPLLLGVALLSAGLDVALYHFWRREPLAEASDLLVLAATMGVLGVLAPPTVRWALSAATKKLMGARPSRRPSRAVGISLGIFIVGVTAWLVIMAWLANRRDEIFAIGPNLGPLAMIGTTLLLVTLTGTGLVALVQEAFPIPLPLFRLFEAVRTPTLPVIGTWLVLVSVLSLPDPAHNVRRDSPRQSEPLRSVTTVTGAFEEWKKRQCLVPLEQASTSGAPASGSSQQVSRPIAPLILVATAGGGIRAAAWTAYVLDRTFGYGEFKECDQAGGAHRPSSWIFAESGVSGGSVGLATYAARQGAADIARSMHKPIPDGAEESDSEAAAGQPSREHPGWVRRQLGQDGLAPTSTWMLLVETPWNLLRFPLGLDRAAVFEGSLERWWPNPPAPETDHESSPPRLFALHMGAPALPLLLLNATSVESGCRFNTSIVSTTGRLRSEPPTRCEAPLDLQPPASGTLGATVDLVDFLCEGQDIPLSAAALLSARFPWISPSGNLEQCPQNSGVIPVRTAVVDGGYHEGSGMATILDVWMSLAPLVAEYNAKPKSPAYIVPVLVQIDSGYDEPAGPGAMPVQPQLLVPPVTVLASRAAIEARARQAGQIEFQRPFNLGADRWFCGPRYAHFALRAHPGPSAPLGWVLSDVSFDDLVQQLASGPVGRDPGKLVQTWLSDNAMAGEVMSRCADGDLSNS